MKKFIYLFYLFIVDDLFSLYLCKCKDNIDENHKFNTCKISFAESKKEFFLELNISSFNNYLYTTFTKSKKNLDLSN